MANRDRSYAGNAPGDLFVDQTCIDCDTCRQVAPLTFHEVDGHAEVHTQPVDPAALHAAAQAQLCCPTQSIGGAAPAVVRAALAAFPLPLAEGVFACGFNAEASYGAHSYLLVRPEGNWLVDSPRWVPQLVAAIAARGGLRGIVLTHRDDVAAAARYAEHFGATRLIHAADADAAPGAQTITGEAAVAIAAGLRLLPVPGHTAGSVALIADGRYCFSGDHLWYSRRLGRLHASRAVCWHSWPQQCRSMQRLAQESFSWVLPGHGQRYQAATPEAMRAELLALSKLMTTSQE